MNKFNKVANPHFFGRKPQLDPPPLIFFLTVYYFVTFANCEQRIQKKNSEIILIYESKAQKCICFYWNCNTDDSQFFTLITIPNSFVEIFCTKKHTTSRKLL